MDALIIAAGFGSRLRDISESKPMTPVAGVALLELGVRQAKAAGAKRVVVVTGHEAERLRRRCQRCLTGPGCQWWRSGSMTGPSPTAGR